MSGDDLSILILAACVVAAVATVVRWLSPAQRLAACLGAWAAVAQVYFPPCVEIGATPFSDPPAAGRRVLNVSLTYHPSDSGVWIDVGRQATGLLATAAAVTLACVLLEWHSRAKRSAAERG